MKYRKLFTTLIAFILMSDSAVATLASDGQKTEQYQYIEKLDKINFLPSMLPVIIENSDIIELTDKQMRALLEWRKNNRQGAIETMNEIMRKRLEIKEAAFSPNVSSAKLIVMQNDVFRLQRELFEYKLSCRDLVINTFNRNNWEDFFLVLADKEMGVTLPDLYISKR